MTDPEKTTPKLASLEENLAQLKATQPTARHDAAGTANSYRAASDFAAAALVGCGLGFGLDYWLKTTPWCLLGGLLVGVIAGFRMMMRDTQTPDKA